MQLYVAVITIQCSVRRNKSLIVVKLLSTKILYAIFRRGEMVLEI